ncbi:MAG: hypothetical protein J6N49_03865 [Alphaproteobacteria bacterium]|nr:hypothetical protein [Alphaproteobacteria bacterium]
MSKYYNEIDKQTLREIGYALWQERNARRLYLRTVATQTNLPARIIEGMEIGKFLQYSAFRRLLNFYGKRIRIVFEECREN